MLHHAVHFLISPNARLVRSGISYPVMVSVEKYLVRRLNLSSYQAAQVNLYIRSLLQNSKPQKRKPVTRAARDENKKIRIL